MARFLSALIVLLASIQVSFSIHFTNSEWDVQEDQEFLLQWEYDSGDPTDSAWHVVVWLAEGQHPLPDGIDLYNASSNANTTSYAFQPACNTVKVGLNAFGIGFEQWGFQILSTSYSPDWTIESWSAACGQSSSLSKGAKIAIGVTMAWLGICLIAVAFFYQRSRLRKRTRLGVKPVTTITPSQSVELQDRAHDEAAIHEDGSNPPPPYAPRT